eukprot:scaffold29491_cov12-Tisochrysis_lutea.AAC.1
MLIRQANNWQLGQQLALATGATTGSWANKRHWQLGQQLAFVTGATTGKIPVGLWANLERACCCFGLHFWPAKNISTCC